MANASCFVLLEDGSLSSGAVAEYRTFNALSKFDAVCKVADYYNIVGLDDIKDDELGFDDVCECILDCAADAGDCVCVITFKGETVFENEDACKIGTIR